MRCCELSCLTAARESIPGFDETDEIVREVVSSLS